MTTKPFDCVEMKRQGAEVVRQRLADMTLEQEIDYWHRRSEQFQQEQDCLRARTPTPGPQTSQSK